MIEVRFRHRADTESAALFHARVEQCIVGISWLWGSGPVKLSFESSGESAACDLTPLLRKGLRGAISYSARFGSNAQDKAIFDDVMTFQIDEAVIDYTEFVKVFFERLVACFQAYRAAVIFDLNLDLDDYEQIVEQSQQTGKDVDGRDTVFRIHPVNFFDKELCQRAFRRSVEVVVGDLVGEVERVEASCGGLLLVVSSDVVDPANLKPLHDHVVSLLGIDGEVPG